MANDGAYPIDVATPVGQVRLNVGDTEFTELDPADLNVKNYANFSDAELASLLFTADGNVLRATAWAFAKLAALAAASPTGSVSIKTNDLGYTSKRAADLIELASWWGDQADAQDDMDSDDLLEIVQFPGFRVFDPALPNVL